MDCTFENKQKKHICIGLLAHVDAGKTTLSEALLYLSGNIRKLGRVDNKDAFFDTYTLERQRGITIFSKQAEINWNTISITLLDTPGHVDFSAEMERTLQVLDYAVLIISGADGIQGHTETLWKLLERYQIPVFLFINKMDQTGADASAILKECKNHLHENCVVFGKEEEIETFWENIAVCDEKLLESYLETNQIAPKEISKLIKTRKLYPCYFGSALKLQGIEELLQGIETYTLPPRYPEEFCARAFKIARDEQGNRLTYIKILGGSLKVRTLIETEKINQIRIYSGTKYETVNEVEAGRICAVTGLSKSYPGEGFGTAKDSKSPLLEPVLTYRIELPAGCSPHTMLANLKQLEEEDPQLHIIWNERLGEIQAQLMGEVQIDILKSLIKERFNIEVQFGTGNIVYKETIEGAVEGVGHFEPLCHYAEVHLYLEALKRGSGLVFDSIVKEDDLDRNWQRLILTHLEEKIHQGVLIGAPITDIKITLVAGKSHLKHTEGGDFREATYRAVRQGLMQAKSVLLEPYYQYRLEIPSELLGRAIHDMERLCGSFQDPQLNGETAVLEGTAPAATMREYQKEVLSYSRGRGRLTCTMCGYAPCHNPKEVIEAANYQAEADTENPAGSVFCSHGAGFYVEWEHVKEYMHLESYKKPEKKENPEIQEKNPKERKPEKEKSDPQEPVLFSSKGISLTAEEEKELEEIFDRTFRTTKKKEKSTPGGNIQVKRKEYQPKESEKEIEEYLLIDGYNIIFAWEELKELAEENIDSARSRLMDMMCNYQGFKGCHLILVFDAYKVAGFLGEVQKYHNIHVVYTKEAETADQYIEKLSYKIGSRHHVTVATSDAVIQLIIMGQGCSRMSAAELKEELEKINQQIRKDYLEQPKKNKQYLFDGMDQKQREEIEEIRLGKNHLKLKKIEKKST
ncbi:MAG: TetM/TetW/TetO/TetS family tetracycline resistance ribosomal protection protein [Lachnospiraceae bacterium]|nr:TetM/TetW/TetO/TetS family tetracycline resistance ribosomal protection protein [Lachnospiraceae bacterium]